jgi:hypothetical protein
LSTKKGIENKVVDALSRVEDQIGKLLSLQGSICTFSEITPQWMFDIVQSYVQDSWIETLLSKLNATPLVVSNLQLHQGLLRKEGRFVWEVLVHGAKCYSRSIMLQLVEAILAWLLHILA